ncbi:MAG: hypothetical protein FD152_4387 [Xanthobacteraceae bacterium]|nr:MAG: hypothetical protein FD152_4387 [Xanthobacteraceae bacterium]
MGTLLHWAVVFLVVALVAAFLGFGGVAGTAMGGAQMLFWVAMSPACYAAPDAGRHCFLPPRPLCNPPGPPPVRVAGATGPATAARPRMVGEPPHQRRIWLPM